MRGRALALVLVVALAACGGDGGSDSGGGDPFTAFGAKRANVPDYRVTVEDFQSSARCWIQLDFEEWSSGAADAVAADYIDKNGPCGDETVLSIRIDAQPWMGCTLWWPAADTRNEPCPNNPDDAG